MSVKWIFVAQKYITNCLAAGRELLVTSTSLKLSLVIKMLTLSVLVDLHVSKYPVGIQA